MRPGEKIRRLLKEHRFQQNDVAAASGISYGTFRSYMQTRRECLPSAVTGVKIAKALGVSTDWLWSDQDWPESGPLQAATAAPGRSVQIQVSVTVTAVSESGTVSIGAECR